MSTPAISLLRTFNILLIAACAAIFCEPALAQPSLTDDAHTSNAPRSADSNFGNNPNLTVSATGNVYIRFNLATTLPAATPGSQVEKATLKLFIGNITSAGKLDVYEVVGAWQESTITYNNAPILGSLVGTTQQLTTDQRGKFLVIDVTETVRQWLGTDGQGAGGIPNHGIALLAHPVDGNTPELINIAFDSKENSQTSHEARLSIYLKDDSAAGLESVAHDATLTGDGTADSPLGVASGAIGGAQLIDGAVTVAKLGDGAVTTTKLADGSVTSAKIASPLSLASTDPAGTLSVTNTGGGAAITTAGSINVAGNGLFTGNLTASGSISLVGLRTELNATSPNVIGGLSSNSVTAGVVGATIGGGGEALLLNRVTDDFGAIGGGRNNQAGDNAGSTSDRPLATVGGGENNIASGVRATIGGGINNVASGVNSFVGGGGGNTASASLATIAGGSGNEASGVQAAVSGGSNNTAGGVQSTVGGGGGNTASSIISTIGGGQTNTASGAGSTISGGSTNVASGTGATVPGGQLNVAQGNFSFAAGLQAKANHNGVFVWGDSTVADFASTGPNQFLIRASGGVGIGTNAPTDPLHVNGTIRVDSLGTAGDTALCRNASNQISDCSSSLRYKHHIAPFTAGLSLIEQLRPISYTWMQAGTRDIGFGAEDVARIDSLLVTRNAKGEVEGVKYDRIAVVLVNAVKEQQQLIKAQQALLESQQRQIENLKKLVCLDRPAAQLCK